MSLPSQSNLQIIWLSAHMLCSAWPEWTCSWKQVRGQISIRYIYHKICRGIRDYICHRQHVGTTSVCTPCFAMIVSYALVSKNVKFDMNEELTGGIQRTPVRRWALSVSRSKLGWVGLVWLGWKRLKWVGAWNTWLFSVFLRYLESKPKLARARRRKRWQRIAYKPYIRRPRWTIWRYQHAYEWSQLEVPYLTWPYIIEMVNAV